MSALIFGKVYDETGETLPGANVYFINNADDGPGQAINGTATDSNGYYEFSTKSASYLRASFLGYAQKTVKAIPGQIDFHLQPAATTLPEIEIIATRPEIKPTSSLITEIIIGVLAGLAAGTVLYYLFIRKK